MKLRHGGSHKQIKDGGCIATFPLISAIGNQTFALFTHCHMATLPHGMTSDLNFFPLAWCGSIWVCLIVKSLMYRVRLSPFVLLLLLCLCLKHDGSKYL